MAETPVIELDWPSPKDDRPGFLVRTPWHRGFIDRLKADLPREDRYWDPDSDAWWCAEAHEEAVTALVCTSFGGCTVISEEGDYYLSAAGERCQQERLL